MKYFQFLLSATAAVYSPYSSCLLPLV